MKIACIVGEVPSLSQTFVLNQIVGLINLGHDVHVFAEKAGSDIKVHDDYKKYGLLERTYYYRIPKNKIFRLLKGIFFIMKYTLNNYKAVFSSLNIFRYGRKAWNFYLLFQCIPFFERGPFDIIHCHFGTLGLKAVLLKQIGVINCKIVTSIRGYDITMIPKENLGIYHELFREGDLFLPVCQSLKERLIQEGCDEKKIVVLYDGIDCSKFEYSQRQRITGEPVKVLTIARLVEKKGVVFALEAVAGLISKGETIEYKIIGDGVLYENFKQMIEKKGVEQQIKLLGWKTHEEIKLLLEDVHVLVAPSLTSETGDQEGIPNVIKEAMASGLPVISTFHSGIPELVTDGVSGFLVPERDSASLADSLEYLINHPEICNEMGKAGRKQVEQKFDIHRLNEELEELYLTLLQKKRANASCFSC
ncbi:MAG: glycosyltransferase [Candidatus Loosdrechtia sp.]|uniref:glycosyltransferase n=1 Tax=Candidatus Loosdrechtia sp. TaxID=3101272 RepID=UPI003A64CE09|nr:MAG: glycosyltransferase [Candidatus Jettenia sp. AMX2]